MSGSDCPSCLVFGPELEIHHLHRGDLVRLAAVDDEAYRLGRDKGAVRLALGVECVATGGAGGLPGLRHSAALEIENVLVRARGRDDLDQLARWRRGLNQPSDAAAVLTAPRVRRMVCRASMLPLRCRRGSKPLIPPSG